MRDNYADKIANKIIEMLQKGAKEWRKEWRATIGKRPMNGNTKRYYNGINWLMLSLTMYANSWDDPRFYTFKQVQKLGGKVKKGEKSSVVQYWHWKTKEEIQEEIDNGIEKPLPFSVKYSNVFNAGQCEGVPELKVKKFELQWSPQEEAERIIQSAGVEIVYDQCDSQFYRPSEDKIHLTPRENFKNADGFYATALHELAHATGHESRLNRQIKNCFGTELYAKEELRAEIASLMMCSKLGIEAGEMNENHIAYIDSWIKDIKDKPSEIFKACADAEKICEWLFEQASNKEVKVA